MQRPGEMHRVRSQRNLIILLMQVSKQFSVAHSLSPFKIKAKALSSWTWIYKCKCVKGRNTVVAEVRVIFLGLLQYSAWNQGKFFFFFSILLMYVLLSCVYVILPNILTSSPLEAKVGQHFKNTRSLIWFILCTLLKESFTKGCLTHMGI